MRKLVFLLTLTGLTAFIAVADDKTQSDKHATGCLVKKADGSFELTENMGAKMTVTGAADLEKHSANHTVTVHGKRKMVDGKAVFEAERVEHVSDKCEKQTH
jgi:hypothetical protein